MTANDTGGAAAIAAEVLRASRGGAAVTTCTVMTVPRAAPVAGGTPVAVGAKLLVHPDGRTLGDWGGGPLQAAVVQAAREAIPHHFVGTLAFTPDGERLQGRRAIAAAAVVEVLVEVVERSPVLLIVGAGHVGRAIGEIGALLGMSVAVLDDRDDYANRDRFPFADHVICGDFAEELTRFPIDANTAVVLVSRGHKQDELSLRTVVERGAAYVGMIGSRRRTATVLAHLRGDGVTEAALTRVFTPIGLDIEAETPEEIAISVLAEIVLTRRGGSGRPLSQYGRSLAGEATG